MKMITISREFGSGGRELGKLIAQHLHFDYYDREIITKIAQNSGLNEDFIEKMLDSRTWQTTPFTYRSSFSIPSVMQPDLQTHLLLEQKKVIEMIAKTGRNCVIVGRNADILLEKEKPFRVFVCADMEEKILRCIKYAKQNESLSRKEIEKNIRRIDKNRAYSREIISDSKWGQCSSYHLTVNTTNWEIRELAPLLSEFAENWFQKNH